MARAWTRPSWLALLAGVIGCGESLVPGEQTERPLLTVNGSILGLEPSPLRVSALWVDPAGIVDDWPSSRSVVIDDLDQTGAFQLRFLRPPPASVIRRVPSVDDETRTAFSFAIAEIVAFDDHDGDGTFAVASGSPAAGSSIVAPDVYRGVASSSGGGYVVSYIEQSRSSADERNAIPALDLVLLLEPGYHLAFISCGADPLTGLAVPVTADEPAVPLALLPPISTFPDVRTCLRTHVRAPLPEP